MSGGHWSAASRKEFELESSLTILWDWFALLPEIRRALDWGISGDTSQEREERAVIACIYAFFDYHYDFDSRMSPLHVLPLARVHQGDESAEELSRLILKKYDGHP